MPPQDNNGWTPVSTTEAPGWTPVEQTSTGITVPRGMVGESIEQPDSFLGGLKRRAVSTFKGMAGLVGPPTEEETAKGQVPLPLHRLGRGIKESEKEAAGQVKEQLAGAKTAYKAGDITAAGLRGLQALNTGLSMLDPFALGAVTNINRISGEKRYKEALGQGAFDAITLLAGKKTGEEVTPTKATNKLAFATDAAPRDIAHVLPELQATAKKLGKPETIGDLGTHIQSTITRLDQQFNSALFRNAHRQVSTQAIADALRAKAADMPPSPDGAALAQKLNEAAGTYERPWTLRQLNAERMLRNSYLKGFYGKADSAQMAAMRSSADSMIDKIVADGSRDILYDELDRLNPGQKFQALKQKQSSLIDIKDAFDKHLDKVEKETAQQAGAPLLAKHSVSASVHPTGVRPYTFVHNVLGRSPEALASSATRSAYGPSGAASAARSAILSMPVGALVSNGGAGMPPPPSDTDQK